MVKQTIQIFARVKPTKAKTGAYDIEDRDDGSSQLSFFIPKELAGGLVNNKKENYKFKFERIFDQKSKQEEIFESVARPVIDNVISGYNGTIFAYGQTGSGKTFTITGGAEKYSQRGIIPRTLSYLYETYEKAPEREFTTNVSYLEIYNNSGYDLLDPKHEAAKLEDLPKVSLVEDEGQNIHLKNLSVHGAGNEEDALNLLFLGDTNRMIAETPMNQASTRSHCIFTIHVTSKEVGSATVRRSKLHLVDLAGSERVSKTGVNGTLLSEAKYINLSLHFLEQVIVALGEKSRSHIPYRNSMMTSVLRDSLGGNCMTTMIATCSIERTNIDESISTCRFAQRVALIKNDALLNEEMDPRLMVERLKKEVALLKEELAMATGEHRTDDLTDEEVERCSAAVNAYLEDNDPEAILNIGADMRKIQRCYKLLKVMVQSSPTPPPPPAAQPETELSHYDKMELKKLQDLLLQRDNEINILVNMLKKEKKRVAGAHATKVSSGHSLNADQTPDPRHRLNSQGRSKGYQSASSVAGSSLDHHHPPSPESRIADGSQVNHRQQSARKAKHHTISSKQILGNMSVGRQEAFEVFKRDYHENASIEKSKSHLRQKYTEAKQLGALVNRDRTVVNKAKSELEHYRMQKAMRGDTTSNIDDTESDFKDALEDAKRSYKSKFAALRELKTEIEHLQHYLERSKVKLMKEFEFWWAEQMSQTETQQQLSSQVKAAWHTPPPSGGSTTTKHSLERVSHVPPLDLHAADAKSSGTFIRHVGPAAHMKQSASDSVSVNSMSSTSLDSHLHHLSPAPVNHSQSLQDKTGQTPSFSHQSQSSQNQSRQAPATSIPLTGDAEADADVMAFLKARQNAIQLAQSRQPR